MPTLFAAIAPCRLCAGTSCGTTACQAGAWIAPSIPLRNVNSSRFAGVAASSDTMSANAPEISAIASSVLTRNFRRSMISATAPAGIARRNIGNEAATCTSDTMNGSGLRSVISQPAAVLYIHPPMFDTTVAIHNAVKLPYRNGPRRERADGVEAAWGLTSPLMATSSSVGKFSSRTTCTYYDWWSNSGQHAAASLARDRSVERPIERGDDDRHDECPDQHD